VPIPGLNPHFLTAEAATGQAQATRLQALSQGVKDSGDSRAGLEKAAKEFEGVFLNQLMKAMRATIPENELFNSAGPTKFYQQMYDTEMSKALADRDTGMGIARLIVQQLETSLAADESAAALQESTATMAPLPARPTDGGLRQYEVHSVSGPNSSRMIRLRRMAEAQEPAVADTLRRFEGAITTAARDTGLDPELLLAVVMEESGGDPEAVSGKGALGLMQLMPATATEVGVEDPRNPSQNIAGGARYLKQMMDRFDGNPNLALAAYNAGPGNVDKAGGAVPDFPETHRYIERVESRYRELTGGTEMAEPTQ
jgi:soluble lytic murein transglycosylase-like protein